MRVVKNSDSARSYTFVTCASGTDGGRQVVLKPDSGASVLVEYSEFIRDYSSEDDPARVASADVVKETLNSIRQTSTLRFAALAVFMGAFGALASSLLNALHADALKTPDAQVLPAPLDWFHWLVGAGLLLAGVGAVFEFVLARNLKCWWEALQKSAPKDAWSTIFAPRSTGTLWAARIALFLPYPCMLAFWLYLLTKNMTYAAAPSGLLLVIVLLLWKFLKPKQSS
jgi:hypothetical protein